MYFRSNLLEVPPHVMKKKVVYESDAERGNYKLPLVYYITGDAWCKWGNRVFKGREPLESTERSRSLYSIFRCSFCISC
jgi:hypothetical protein